MTVCRTCGGPNPTSRTVYCSQLCCRRFRRTVKHPRIPAVCEHCAAPYMVLVKARAIGAGKYCSRKCVGDAAAALGIFKGEKNPRWLGGVSKDNMRYRRRQKERWPIKERARRMLRDAVRRGRLTRQPCERCGNPKTAGHHTNYKRPLHVHWLCRPCHDAEHAAIKAAAK